MIQYLIKELDGTLKEVPHIQEGCWVNLVHPSMEEMKEIAQSLAFPLDFLLDAVDQSERARFEKADDNILIIVDSPYNYIAEDKTVTYETQPLGIILTQQHLITISPGENPIVQSFINNQINNMDLHKKSQLALLILDQIADQFLTDLAILNKSSEKAQKTLKKTVKNQHLYELMEVEKSLVYFLTALKATNVVIERLPREVMFSQYKEDEELLYDVLVDMRQALEMAEVQRDIVDGTMEAYNSIIGNNMNDTMKNLTIFTILLTIPTIVFSFYGMNVPLPFEHYQYSWILTILLAYLFVLVISKFVLRKR